MAFNIFRKRKNIYLAIISIILGIFIWYYARTDAVITDEKGFSYIFKTPPHLIVKESRPDSIILEVKAKVRVHRFIRKVKPTINIKERKTGTQVLNLERDNIIFPVWVNILDYKIIRPETLVVTVDSLVEKKVPLITIGEINFEPKEITLRGPKTLLNDINYLSPDSIPKGEITTVTVKNKLVEVYPRKLRIQK